MDRRQADRVSRLLRLPGTRVTVRFDASQVPKRIMTMAIKMLQQTMIVGYGSAAHLAGVMNRQFDLGCSFTHKNSMDLELSTLDKDERLHLINLLQADLASALLTGNKHVYGNPEWWRQNLQKNFASNKLELQQGRRGRLTLTFHTPQIYNEALAWRLSKVSEAAKAKVEVVVSRLRAGEVFELMTDVA